MDNPVVKRLLAALNSHDVADVVACFGEDVTTEWPAHPAPLLRRPGPGTP